MKMPADPKKSSSHCRLQNVELAPESKSEINQTATTLHSGGDDVRLLCLVSV